MSSELIDIVNKSDQVIGQVTRGEAFAKGLLHRASNLFIFNSKGQVYLQQRSPTKTTFPNHWDLSVTEHVKAGESYEKAARRGTREELKIEDKLVLELIWDTHMQDNSWKHDGKTTYDLELVQTFKTIYNDPVQIDHEEVSDGRFFDIQEIDEAINSAKLSFTPWFLDEWHYLVEHKLLSTSSRETSDVGISIERLPR